MLNHMIGWVTTLQKYAVLMKRRRELRILQAYEAMDPVEQCRIPAANRRRIAFIIPGMPAYSGGHTSILRLGTYLRRKGNEVAYVSYEPLSAERMRRNALINFRQFEGQLLPPSGMDAPYDIAVATTWLSAYHLYKHRHRYLYKAYFIQDFEPAFYAEGDLYRFALNTYRMGLHLISLGPWNKKRIEGAVGIRNVDWIDFPFEEKEYEIVYIPKNLKDRIRIAVYFKIDTKRGPHILLQALEKLICELAKRGRQCDIFFFGIPRYLKLPFGRNLGQLNHVQLKKLYRSCDLGVVGSFSNISLVDYEMIASSLPVVEFSEGSASSFFKPEHMILAPTDPGSFVHAVLPYLTESDRLNAMIKEAQAAISTKTWESAAAQFAAILGIDKT